MECKVCAQLVVYTDGVRHFECHREYVVRVANTINPQIALSDPLEMDMDTDTDIEDLLNHCPHVAPISDDADGPSSYEEAAAQAKR